MRREGEGTSTSHMTPEEAVVTRMREEQLKLIEKYKRKYNKAYQQKLKAIQADVRVDRLKKQFGQPSVNLLVKKQRESAGEAIKRSQSAGSKFERWLPEPFLPKVESQAKSFYPMVYRHGRHVKTRFERSLSLPDMGTPGTAEEKTNPIWIHKKRRRLVQLMDRRFQRGRASSSLRGYVT